MNTPLSMWPLSIRDTGLSGGLWRSGRAVCLLAALAALGTAVAQPAQAEFRAQTIDNDYAYEIEAAAQEGKRLILFFHQPGCPYCDKMRARVFPNSEVQAYFTDRFVMLENNIKGNLAVVMPDGTQGTESDFGRKLRVRATPVTAFFDSDGALALKTTGYLDPQQFMMAGKYVETGVHKSGKSFFRYLKENDPSAPDRVKASE